MASAWYISGTISVRPPKDTATAIRPIMRPMFFSIFWWPLDGAGVFLSVMSGCLGRSAGVGGVWRQHRLRHRVLGRLEGLPCIDRHQAHAGKDQQAAAEAHE